MRTHDEYTTLYESVIKEWARALRSGDYKQGRDALYNPGKDTYCCLGVLCDLFPSSYTEESHQSGRSNFVIPEQEDFSRSSASLPGFLARLFQVNDELSSENSLGHNPWIPASVIQEVGLKNSSYVSATHGGRLAGMNDANISFSAIADMIEATFLGDWARNQASKEDVQEVLDQMADEGFFEDE